MYVGGLRQRLIHDSLYNYIKDNLDELGWFDSPWADPPINVRSTAFPDGETIPFNTLVVTEEHFADDDGELGSNFGEMTLTYYVDFYASNETIGKHVIHDIRDILRGRFSSLGLSASQIPIIDYTSATPDQIFTCDIENLQVDRARDFPHPWQQNWFVCSFNLTDAYLDEDD